MATSRSLMDIRVEMSGTVAVVTVVGECDASEASRLAYALRDARLTAEEVHLDLSELAFLDSATLRVLYSESVEFELDSSRLVLVDPQPGIRRVLQIAGLDSRFEVRSSRDGASNGHFPFPQPDPWDALGPVDEA